MDDFTRRRLDPEAAAAIMRSAGVEPIEPYRNSQSPWQCCCLNCGQVVNPRIPPEPFSGRRLRPQAACHDHGAARPKELMRLGVPNVRSTECSELTAITAWKPASFGPPVLGWVCQHLGRLEPGQAPPSDGGQLGPQLDRGDGQSPAGQPDQAVEQLGRPRWPGALVILGAQSIPCAGLAWRRRCRSLGRSSPSPSARPRISLNADAGGAGRGARK